MKKKKIKDKVSLIHEKERVPNRKEITNIKRIGFVEIRV
jgi:hypothetical protein